MVVTEGLVGGVLVQTGALATARLAAVGAESGGNGFVLLLALERLPARPTAERDDCAVDDLRRRTRFPPEPVVPDESPGRMPGGPGKAG